MNKETKQFIEDYMADRALECKVWEDDLKILVRLSKGDEFKEYPLEWKLKRDYERIRLVSILDNAVNDFHAYLAKLRS